ncbi:MAG: hypothetical protein AAF281_14185, partial [Pseudomonadota bacterium]
MSYSFDAPVAMDGAATDLGLRAPMAAETDWWLRSLIRPLDGAGHVSARPEMPAQDTDPAEAAPGAGSPRPLVSAHPYEYAPVLNPHPGPVAPPGAARPVSSGAVIMG